MLSQSKKASFVEACVNTLFGFTIQVAAQYGLFVFFGVKISTSQFWLFTVAMTVLSVARGFVIRRLFNSEFWKRWKRKQEAAPKQSGPLPPVHPNCRSTVTYIPTLDKRTKEYGRQANHP